MINFQSLGPHAVRQLREEVDRLFDSFAGSTPVDAVRRFVGPRGFPAVNLWEQQDGLMLEAELPGLKAEDVDIALQGHELILKGRRPALAESPSYHRRERSQGEFVRSVRLPYDVDADRIEAALRDGVLQVRLPKAPAATPRKIPIST